MDAVALKQMTAMQLVFMRKAMRDAGDSKEDLKYVEDELAIRAGKSCKRLF